MTLTFGSGFKPMRPFDLRRERRQEYRYIKQARRAGITFTKAQIQACRLTSIRKWERLNDFPF